jgi:pimeloyl-ACP methyl ester carboxylesterase
MEPMDVRSGIARCGDVELFYEDLGDVDAPPVLLIMGVGAQLPTWPDGFCELLLGRGLRVIRFDHRDTGLSTKMHGQRAAGPVLAHVGRYLIGRPSSVPRMRAGCSNTSRSTARTSSGPRWAG